jgi:N-acyl homoserine lactone hydrolase
MAKTLDVMERSMRLHFFDCGTLQCDKSLITMGRDMGKMIDIPVPFFVILHPKGTLLYDTGMAKEVAEDPKRHWGKVADIYKPHMQPQQYCTNQLLSHLGIKPESVQFIVLSHLHSDHAGGLRDFPNARILVQRSEMQWAYTADFYQKPAYIRADFDHAFKYLPLEGWRDSPYDVFGDGSVQVWFMPGHTPGHQALSVRLAHSGTFLLTGDACYTNEILMKDILPGVVWNSEEAVNAIRKIRWLRDVHQMQIVPGHDPVAWEGYRKAPAYYD